MSDVLIIEREDLIWLLNHCCPSYNKEKFEELKKKFGYKTSGQYCG